MIKAVLFDFGGVLAEEGFKQGLKVIGKERGFDPEDFYEITGELVYQMGYVSGASDEHSFWEAVREKTGVKEGEDQEGPFRFQGHLCGLGCPPGGNSFRG